ncbi:hypothetical protein VE00_00831 [Pseudogymnoascus sp. WSF 3629]|nr:hypothetical protein VE00_00831 [Pseudogymnoascus sp. WSF 3629]
MLRSRQCCLLLTSPAVYDASVNAASVYDAVVDAASVGVAAVDADAINAASVNVASTDAASAMGPVVATREAVDTEAGIDANGRLYCDARGVDS